MIKNLRKIIFNEGERTKQLKINVFIMIIIRGLSILISLLYVPLLLKSLDTVNYGIWLTLTSIISWVGFLDIGLGNGLRNKLTESLAQNDTRKSKEYISSSYAALIIIMLIFCIIFLAISNFIPWYRILNASILYERELYLLANIVMITFCCQFVLNLIISILFSFQKPAESSLLALFSQLFSFILILIAVKIFNCKSLLILGTIISIGPILISLFYSIFFFKRNNSIYKPSIKYVKINRIKEVVSLGINFFIIQIVTIVLFQSNNIIISNVINNEAVVMYNISYKYIGILLMIYTIIVTPIWSATTDAYSKGDINWIKKIVKKLNLIFFIFSIIGLLMLFLSKFVYKIWIGNSIEIDFTTTLLLLIYVIGRMAYSNYGYVINGIGKVKAQMIITLFISIIYLPLAIFAGKYFGINGILIVLIFSSFLNFIWSKYQYELLIKGKAKGIFNE